MSKSAGPRPAGYDNGGIEPMEQFEKLSDKIGNSLQNLEFTRDMLRSLAENEKKSAKIIAATLNQKTKSLRFSVVDSSIQNFWKKQESNRRHFSAALQTKIIDAMDNFINTAHTKRKRLIKDNSKIQRTFIEVSKEVAKQKQICEKEWKKLDEQIQKNEQNQKLNKLGKVKELNPLQDKCSKAFEKFENLNAKLNELEQINHKHACEIGELLHESQKYAADRLAMHYNMAVSTKKYMEEFVASNKSIVQSKAPPLTDILWRWLTYPKNHQTGLPCTSSEVFQKTSIAQRFQRRVESDFQDSEFLKPPKSGSNSKNASNASSAKKKQAQNGKVAVESAESNQAQQQQQSKKKEKKKKRKSQKVEENATDVNNENTATKTVDVPATDDWNVDFGDSGDTNDVFGSSANVDANAAANDFPADDDPFANTNGDFGFGDEDKTDNVFGDSNNTNKEKKENKEKENAKEEINGFEDIAFDDKPFGDDFGQSNDLQIANENNNENVAATDSNWNTNFGDDTFANPPNENIDKNAANNEDVDHLFANSEAADIFGGDTTKGNDIGDNNTANTKITSGDGLFDNTFGGDDVFGNDINEKKEAPKTNQSITAFSNEVDVDVDVDVNDEDLFANDNDFDFGADGDLNNDELTATATATNDPLFDDAFDDDPAIEFPEFDVNATNKKKGNKSKKRKSKAKGNAMNKPTAKMPEPSPQPNEITKIPEPVISFDAPEPSNTFSNKNEEKKSDDDEEEDTVADNPFASDPFAGDDDEDAVIGVDGDDDDDIDADNPFAAMFDEPESATKKNNGNEEEKDDGNDDDLFDPFSLKKNN